MNRSVFFLGLVLLTTFFISCKDIPEKPVEAVVKNKTLNLKMVQGVLQKHLDAVSNRDLKTLESTLSPDGNMQLILPETEIIDGTDGFMGYHREWFKTPDWTIDSKILNSEVGETMAMIIVESILVIIPSSQRIVFISRLFEGSSRRSMSGLEKRACARSTLIFHPGATELIRP